MNSDWMTLPLEDCLEVLIDYRGKTPVKTTSGIPLITAKIIKAGRIETPTEFIATDNYDSWMRRGIPKVGDVVLTVEAPLGEVAQLGPEKIALAQRVVTLRGKSGFLDSTYLLYLLQSEEVQSQLRSRATGTTVLGIKQSELRKVPIMVPPLAFQLDVASTMKALDERIFLLREANASLEGIAQALFKSWFVDFDPVRAKMEKRIPEGMDEATVALFPDELEESELGMVPRGWQPTRVGDFVELAYGKALKAGDREPGSVPVYGSGGITGWHNVALVNAPSIIIGRKGTIGTLYWESRPFFPIDTVFFVKSKFPLTYCYYLLQTLGLGDMNTDAAVPGLNRKNVYRLKVPVCPQSLLAAFNNLAAPLQGAIDHNNEHLKTLTSIRDALLPRLISGQLRLPDIENQIESAAA